ncbi:hypothetical protein [Puniceibacterium sp. IMCC21224]|uniref:hypothetical protein n=1 Tax=Puniceibacterium sp. IMCC21224 TaxID=1618204 RepID=UPI00065D8D5C|nr:hypothetical protein [Puniceibacterium sp. IMCC21224]KMK63820.1 hypothetical protein IMCC21224_187 [Puniceibacterium sp. IMCC21224]
MPLPVGACRPAALRAAPPALPVAVVLVVSLAVSAAAQSYGTDGIQLSLGLALRTEVEDNSALDRDSAGPTSEANARLSLGLLSETRTERLSLDFSGTLGVIDTPDDTSQINGFKDPGVSLSYGRTSAAARLGLSASLRESRLSRDYFDINEFDEGTTGTDGTALGIIDVVSGTAVRRRSAAEASLNWGDDRPLGFGTFARINTTTYRDGTANGLDGSTLEDSRRRTLGATMRMDLDATRRLDLGLTWSDFEQDNTTGLRETLSLNAGLTVDRPLGALTASLNAANTEEGERYGATLDRSLALPLGQVSGQIGLSRSVDGQTYLNGGLNLRRDLARGALNFGLSRTVSSSDADDTEQLNTRASLGLTQELTPLSRVRFGVNLSKAEETATGAETLSGEVGASLSHDFTSDWTLETGYSHRIRNEDSQGAAHSNRVFLELRRTFLTRF